VKPKDGVGIWLSGGVSLLLLCLTGAALFSQKEVSLEIPGLLGEGFRMGTDRLSLVFAFSASLVWFFAYLFSIPYMKHEEHHHGDSLLQPGRGSSASLSGYEGSTLQESHGSSTLQGAHRAVPSGARPSSQNLFYFGFTASLLCTLLVFFSRDLFTLFILFESLTFFSYLLVRHEGNREAEEASGLYLFMSLAGGLLVLMGAMLLKAKTGSTVFSALEMLDERDALVAAGFLIAGFGVKAGIFGLHVWLPRAHPVAPSPASAVLSGVMIKVGAYGILRVVLALETFHAVHALSDVLALLGLANLYFGGFGALFSQNLKKVLAYSSVSQMGYILLGISTVSSGEHAGPVALSGVLFHVLNHGLFKSLLFMVAGYLLITRGSVKLSDLRGSLRKDTVASLGFLAGFSAIVGLPGLNGLISKTLIHDALIISSTHSGSLWSLAERGFILGTFITAAYFIRLSVILF